MAAFAGDLGDVLSRARAAGVGRIMTCATSLDDATSNLELARRHRLAASAGFHPHQASRWDGESEASLLRLIHDAPEIAAVGEVGLDFHYSFSPPDTQRDVLRRQIALARSVRLPLVVHTRKATEDLRRILLEERAHEAGGMLHCFSEDAGFARWCLDQGFHVSFSGIVTFPRAEAIREAARLVPLDRLLVETDSPYLAPVPHRGGRNEPAFVTDVARCLAGLKGVSLEVLAAATAANFDRLFGRRGAAGAAP